MSELRTKVVLQEKENMSCPFDTYCLSKKKLRRCPFVVFESSNRIPLRKTNAAAWLGTAALLIE